MVELLGRRHGGVLGFCWGGRAFPPRILNMTVPQVGHRPLIARRPFFITSSTASAISFFDLHLTQYPSGISSCLRSSASRVSKSRTSSVGGRSSGSSTGKTVRFYPSGSWAAFYLDPRARLPLYSHHLLGLNSPAQSLTTNALVPELRPVWQSASLYRWSQLCPWSVFSGRWPF